jgi:hypothetical protein
MYTPAQHLASKKTTCILLPALGVQQRARAQPFVAGDSAHLEPLGATLHGLVKDVNLSLEERTVLGPVRLACAASTAVTGAVILVLR